MKKKLLLIYIILLSTGCSNIEHTPFGTKTQIQTTDMNSSAIQQITQNYLPASQMPLRIGLIADTHSNYSDFRTVVEKINMTLPHFSVHLGDLTEMGMAWEFNLAHSIISKFNSPIITVIGNHDTIGQGKLIYKKHFGNFDHFFDYAGFRFVFFNNNRIDFLPVETDFNWLKQTVENSTLPILLFQHVDPWNKFYFNETQISDFQNILDSQKIKAIFHGHLHVFKSELRGSTTIQQIARVENEQYAFLDLFSDKMILYRCQKGSCENETLYFNPDSNNK